MGGNPVIVDEINLSKKMYSGMREEDLVARETTVYGFYQSHFGINVFRVLDRLSGAVADTRSAELLGVDVNTPLLSVVESRTHSEINLSNSVNHSFAPTHTNIGMQSVERFAWIERNRLS